MVSRFKLVRDFHEYIGQPGPSAPELPDGKTIEHRVRLMLEEVTEYCEAAGYRVTISATRHGEPDLVQMMHEAGDVLYVAEGAFHDAGVNSEPVVLEIHGANMRKVPQGPGKKPLKPEGWMPANVSAVILSGEADP